ncbi:hypothetical protein [Ilumatobacter sp.]|uniref:hypothetical protein n=1 Tax=Ilumatobacter sp. TaxID=1967498 RepID=UPI003AF70C3B
MAEIDELVRRTVASVSMIADRAAGFSTKLLLVVVAVCVGGFLLGVAALSDGIQAVWIVLGIVFGSIAIGCAGVARWRVGAVRRHIPELATEVRTMIGEGAPESQTVIDTFVVEVDGAAPEGADPDAPGGPPTGSAIVMSRQMGGFGSAVGPGLARWPRLFAAVRALTTFPFLMLAAVGISLVFGFLGFIFLIALAL